MKMQLSFPLWILFGIFLLVSCSSSPKGDYLPPLKAEIPAVLKDNNEAVTFIKESTEALNQWSVALENLVVDCSPYVGKEESELSVTEKDKLGKIMMDFVATMGQFAVKVAEIEQNASTIEYDLNDEELDAMTSFMTILENRVADLNAKYQDFGKEE